ncbi:hypothetical protein EVG20_g7528, partial [Dentipellis fragilis]
MALTFLASRDALRAITNAWAIFSLLIDTIISILVVMRLREWGLGASMILSTIAEARVAYYAPMMLWACAAAKHRPARAANVRRMRVSIVLQIKPPARINDKDKAIDELTGDDTSNDASFAKDEAFVPESQPGRGAHVPETDRTTSSGLPHQLLLPNASAGNTCVESRAFGPRQAAIPSAHWSANALPADTHVGNEHIPIARRFPGIPTWHSDNCSINSQGGKTFITLLGTHVNAPIHECEGWPTSGEGRPPMRRGTRSRDETLRDAPPCHMLGLPSTPPSASRRASRKLGLLCPEDPIAHVCVGVQTQNGRRRGSSVRSSCLNGNAESLRAALCGDLFPGMTLGKVHFPESSFALIASAASDGGKAVIQVNRWQSTGPTAPAQPCSPNEGFAPAQLVPLHAHPRASNCLNSLRMRKGEANTCAFDGAKPDPHIHSQLSSCFVSMEEGAGGEHHVPHVQHVRRGVEERNVVASLRPGCQRSRTAATSRWPLKNLASLIDDVGGTPLGPGGEKVDIDACLSACPCGNCGRVGRAGAGRSVKFDYVIADCFVQNKANLALLATPASRSAMPADRHLLVPSLPQLAFSPSPIYYPLLVPGKMERSIDIAALRFIYNETQASVTSRVETDDLCAAVCARVGPKAFLQYPPQYRNVEPLRVALVHWDSVIAVQLKNAAVIAALASNDLGARIHLDATTDILIIPTIELLCRIPKTQSAVLISNPGVLLVWDDSLDGVVKLSRRIQTHLQSAMHANDVVDPLPYLGGLPSLSAIPQEGMPSDESLLTAPLTHGVSPFTYREPSFQLWPNHLPKASATPDLRFALKRMALHGSPFSSSTSSSSMSSSPWTPERTICLADISPPPAETELDCFKNDPHSMHTPGYISDHALLLGTSPPPPSSTVSITPSRSVGQKFKRLEVDEEEDTQNDDDEDEYLPAPT